MQRWLAARHLAKGALLTLAQCWGLARLWYRDRAQLEWERPAPHEAQAILASLGLTGPFWSLDAEPPKP